MNKSKRFLMIFVFILFLSGLPVYAELLSSNTYGYSIDLPEGFVLSNSTRDGKSYQFENLLYPVQVIIKVYDKREFVSVQNAMEKTMQRISANYETADITWRNSDCTLSQFEMTLENVIYSGWGVCVALPEDKGYFTMLSYSTSKEYEPVILSAVDSIFIDNGSFFETGPVTAFAFPLTQEKNVQLEIDDVIVNTVLDEDDIAANEFVIEREFKVLCLYVESDLGISAWKRYYRQIYRDAFGRLKRPAFDIYATLSSFASESDKNINVFLAEKLLSWTQGFKYDRNFSKSDISSIPGVLSGELSSDCDSRSLLLAILLHQMNMDTVLFVSSVYSHAMLGVDLNLAGAKIDVNGKNYLLGETTAHVPIGRVAQEMSVTENWIPVTFPR